MVGGGSGGHITPLLAVARELRSRYPEARIYYAFERKSRFANLPRTSKDLDGIYEVWAGKFRRYHGRSWLAHLLDVPTNLKNLRDFFYFLFGYVQSQRLLKRLQPDVVFIKGSSVGVPIGKACVRLGVPYFTHDSDSVASLTNRLLAREAVYHAVGLPLSFYSRSDDKLRYTGIPLGEAFSKVSSASLKKFRAELGVPEDALVISVTGGSLGASRLNEAFVGVAESLLASFPKLYILHQTGSEVTVYPQLSDSMRQRVQEWKFTDKLAAVTGAADMVVARAGATTIAELAVQGKACIFVPNPQLTGGQQTKNAEYLVKHKAAVVVTEQESTEPALLEQAISDLLRSKEKRRRLSAAMLKIAKPDAAAALTDIIVSIAEQKAKS